MMEILGHERLVGSPVDGAYDFESALEPFTRNAAVRVRADGSTGLVHGIVGGKVEVFLTSKRRSLLCFPASLELIEGTETIEKDYTGFINTTDTFRNSEPISLAEGNQEPDFIAAQGSSTETAIDTAANDSPANNGGVLPTGVLLPNRVNNVGSDANSTKKRVQAPKKG